MKNKFQLSKEDYEVIEIVRKELPLIIKYQELTPKQIIGFGNFLYALERLPLKTRGINSYIKLTKVSDEFYPKIITFRLEEEIFYIDFEVEFDYDYSGSREDVERAYDVNWFMNIGRGWSKIASVNKLEYALAFIFDVGIEVKVEDSSVIELEEDN